MIPLLKSGRGSSGRLETGIDGGRFFARPFLNRRAQGRDRRLKRDDRLHIAAPFGLADLFALRPRPNPRRFSANFSQVAAGVTRRWPEVTVEGPNPKGAPPPRN